MKATDFPRVAKSLLPFDSIALFPVDAFFAIPVAAPPLNNVNDFAVFVVKEVIDGTAFLIRDLPTISRQAASANPGATAVAAAAAATTTAAVAVVVALPATVDIVAIAVFVTVPASATTGPIMPIFSYFLCNTI